MTIVPLLDGREVRKAEPRPARNEADTYCSFFGPDPIGTAGDRVDAAPDVRSSRP